MGKRKYQTVRVNRFDWEALAEDVEQQRIIIDIDVAKEKMVACVFDEGEAVLKTVRWSHPNETGEFVDLVERLRESAAGVSVAMEPSGVDGDALRWQVRRPPRRADGPG